MAAGDITATIHGSYAVSGAALKAAIETINAHTNGFTSGGALYPVAVSNGKQILLISTAVAKS